MARLSSTSRMRPLRATAGMESAWRGSAMAQLHSFVGVLERNLQHEARSAPAPFAVCRPAPTHRLRRVGAVVQAEAVTVAARREAVPEDPAHVLGRDADAVVLHLDTYVALARRVDGDPQHTRRVPFALFESVLRVADEIDDDLQELMAIGQHRRERREIAHDLDVRLAQADRADCERSLEQLAEYAALHHAAVLGVGLLRGHDALHVLEMLEHIVDVAEDAAALVAERATEAVEVFGNLLPLGIAGEEHLE